MNRPNRSSDFFINDKFLQKICEIIGQYTLYDKKTVDFILGDDLDLGSGPGFRNLFISVSTVGMQWN